MNKIPHPTREVAHFVARILAARQTPSEEIPHLIYSVRDTLQALRGEIARSASPQPQQAVVAALPEPQRRTRRPKEAIKPAVRVTRRSEPAPPLPPAVPQLMRRAE